MANPLRDRELLELARQEAFDLVENPVPRPPGAICSAASNRNAAPLSAGLCRLSSGIFARLGR